jgi:hypothetical protein
MEGCPKILKPEWNGLKKHGGVWKAKENKAGGIKRRLGILQLIAST